MLTQVDEWTRDVITSQPFSNLDKEILVLLLKRDTLSASEVDLYRAAVRWARAEAARQSKPEEPSVMREILGEALFLIRFPTISGNDFAFIIDDECPGLLTEDDRIAIFNHFADPTNVVPFPSDKRNSFVQPVLPAGKNVERDMVVSRFRKFEQGKNCTYDEVHKVDFTVSAPVLITGFGIYSTRCDSGERNIYVELIHGETGEVLGEGSYRCKCYPGECKIYQVRFKQEVLIRAETIYTACAKFDNQYPYPTYSGVQGKHE